jgi:hypothetical protein
VGLITPGGGGGSAATSPGFEIGYDQITASVTVASTTEATGTTIISAAAHTFDGALVLAHFFAPLGQVNTIVGGTMTVSLFEGATQIARFGAVVQPAGGGANIDNPFTGFIRFTPTAASHTYTVTAFNGGGGTGIIGAGVGGTGAYTAAFLRFTKV